MAYDVIIVGGRPAGTTLALRLANAGLQVLLLERGTHPSKHPASSPVIYAPSMALLDELHLNEADYAANTPKIRLWVIEADGHFKVEQPLPNVQGRDYSYAIDRARFDGALWDVAAKHPNITAKQRHTVTAIIQHEGEVQGVEIMHDGQRETVHAPLVVGADGRFSTVAKQVNAATYHQHDDQPTSIYYAYWRNVSPIRTGEFASHLFSTGGDYGLLIMESADNSAVVVIEGRSDVIQPNGQNATDFYTRFLQQHPRFWERLQHAERITPVHGMKRVSNHYRQVGGVGWALVGDAVHQKDPLDGQGIYDALFTAKALSAAIIAWHNGEKSWHEALQRYEQALYAETYAMYVATLQRVEREIYTRRPSWFMGGPARWLYADDDYRQHWARLFVRDIPPHEWFTPRVIGMATLRGMLKTLLGHS